MSNPGVIVLDNCKKNLLQKIFNRNSFRYVQIEDNIGEAIHIHFDDFRIELTLEEFFQFCDSLKETLNNLVNVENFNINQIDPLFFRYASKHIDDLKEIEIVDINKTNVRFLLNNNKYKLYTFKKFDEISPEDLFKKNSEVRNYKFSDKSINQNYFDKNIDENFKPIIDENYVIRDGKHRLYTLFKKKDIAQAYLWKFNKKNVFKVNLIVSSLKEILIRLIIFLTKKKNRLFQIIQNFIEKKFSL